MKIKEIIIEQQKDFIQNLKIKITDFISEINKSEIETILLSGSVSRGDYFPEEIDGMVDVIFMKKTEALVRRKVFSEKTKSRLSHSIIVPNIGGFGIKSFLLIL